MEKIKSFFKIEERGSSVKVEVLAGITTFLAMAYILAVNPGMLAGVMGTTPEAIGQAGLGVFFATAVAAAIATLIMGLYANYPVALAPGMGVNAFFAFTAVALLGGSWEAALAAVLVSGVLFLIISVTGLRRMVIDAIPRSLKYAVGAGIGFFITFIGLKNAGIIVDDPATFVRLQPDLTQAPVLLAIFGIVLVVVLYARGNRFALIISMVATGILGLILGAAGVANMPAYTESTASGLFDGVAYVFGGAFRGFGDLFASSNFFIVIFTFLFIDFFDTAGTLMAVGNQAGLTNEEGELVDGDKALIADSVGTIAGAILGTSTVTSYIESTTGIEQGARTGLSSVVVGVLFLLSIPLVSLLSVVNGVYMGQHGAYPWIAIVYSPVTAMALVLVGALMVGQLKNIDWEDKAVVIASFFTIIFMILTFSIADGIALGFIFYPIAMVAQKRGKEVNVVMYVLAVIFVLNYVLHALA